jgi:hypothetical protein
MKNILSLILSIAFWFSRYTTYSQEVVCLENGFNGGYNSFIYANIYSGSSVDGLYDVYCANINKFLWSNDSITAKVLTKDQVDNNTIVYPEYLDEVTWLLNQNIIGTTSPYGEYTASDIQCAIWQMLNGTYHLESQYESLVDINRVNILVSNALSHNGYVPYIGSYDIRILKPISTSCDLGTDYDYLASQPLIITLPSDIQENPPLVYVRTIGYWKTHPENWPVNTLIIANKTYSQNQLLTILNNPSNSDKRNILMKQLIATMLNVANGTDVSCINNTVQSANQWLINNPKTISKQAWVIGEGLKNILDDYNNGLLCNPHE